MFGEDSRNISEQIGKCVLAEILVGRFYTEVEA